MVLQRIETVLSKILDKILFIQAKGIRRRWLLNSVSFLVVILAVMVIAFSAVIRSYYDSDVLTDVEGKATTASNYFTIYSSGTPPEERDALARNYIETYERDGEEEMQLLSPQGDVVLSTNPATPAGTLPDTEELAKAAQDQTMCSWRGKTELSDGRVTPHL